MRLFDDVLSALQRTTAYSGTEVSARQKGAEDEEEEEEIHRTYAARERAIFTYIRTSTTCLFFARHCTLKKNIPYSLLKDLISEISLIISY